MRSEQADAGDGHTVTFSAVQVTSGDAIFFI